jgi:L-amino acid N-acyltransferase YncA
MAAMSQRNEYALTLSGSAVDLPHHTATDGLSVRRPRQDDAEALAVLMIEAYRGTIDYDGETVEDARSEIQAYLAGERGGPAQLAPSRLAEADGKVVAACLVAQWDKRQYSLITYVMTHAAWKQHGLGRQLVRASIDALRQDGHCEVRAVITAGNEPSERLFVGLGFRKIEQE